MDIGQPSGTTDTECFEWQYEMRRVMQEILPRLFLGPVAASKKKKALRENNITHILVVRSVKEQLIAPAYPDEFQYYVMEIPDCPTASLLPYLPEVLQFIDVGRQSGGILIHCDSGISRSAAVTIAYVMRDQQMSYDNAFQYVADRRCCVHPNLGFMHQLGEYEFIAQSLGHTPAAVASAGKKRQFDDEAVLDDMEQVRTYTLQPEP